MRYKYNRQKLISDFELNIIFEKVYFGTIQESDKYGLNEKAF